MIFQVIRTSIAKKPYIFVIFQGGPDLVHPPLDLRMKCMAGILCYIIEYIPAVIMGVIAHFQLNFGQNDGHLAISLDVWIRVDLHFIRGYVIM